MKRIVIYSFLLLLLASCLDSNKEVDEKVNCESFVYSDPITINSSQQIDSVGWIYKFEPNNGFKKALDSIKVKISNRDKLKPNEFVMWDRSFQLDTKFAYKIKLSNTITCLIEDITSKVESHNSMFKSDFVCVIKSYKLNNQLINKYKEIRVNI